MNLLDRQGSEHNTHLVDPDFICCCNANDMYLLIITATYMICILLLQSTVDPRV